MTGGNLTAADTAGKPKALPEEVPGGLPKGLIIAGPTASGKSALALAVAERFGGVIINADSMQVYRELRVLTARPTPADEARVPHRLYGVRPAADAGSVAWWRATALAEMEAARAAGRLPILTGGTGMYFASLTGGLSDIPDPGPDARAEARRLLAEQGAAALHASLAHVDPATAARLRPEDSQRIARAWEVWRGTGRGLVAWQSQRTPPAAWDFAAIRLDPPRTALRAAIAGRFDAMLHEGAIEEVRALLALGLDPALPAMRAHGVPELSAYLSGRLSLDDARRRTELVTGQYTKRQATWFRHHPLATQDRVRTINSRFSSVEQFSESDCADLFAFIQQMA
ncbi:MAG TPA: tRNA (adenosine(37)-N6)-dimethylallyltransferase MiaA [Rhodopila sp.]|uniref:tRNA (adenosine(37)-N6)-dimethylallyltransferase MiaA n=1 Tax=Rhodopila sp. TaxID=2480087 RepID=UPI002CB6D0E2|nr:tRNA (adenosine(37)-N6)-dimethylallyltransferase MiaA [Rhodopila sp.]HVY16055.1 tRNA (adenosine(37)-N6)-dimethylallyltransferase MiaA [Rhodopila sp.]